MNDHATFTGMASVAAAMNAEEDALLAYECETQTAFQSRTNGQPDFTGECIKREYAKATPNERRLWGENPFEDRNDHDGIDHHAAKHSHDGAGLRIL